MAKNTSDKKQSELEIITFRNSKKWERWLEKNYNKSKGIWIKFYKKNSDITSVTHDEALDVALCYGWIDGQLKKGDEKFYLQKFSPRWAKSIWSKRNIEHVERLKKAGRIKPSGLKEFDVAKSDGRLAKAYDPQSKMTIPDDFLKRLSKNKKAFKFFESLNRANKYSIAWRLQTAKKPETREKRMIKIFEMLSKGEKFH